VETSVTGRQPLDAEESGNAADPVDLVVLNATDPANIYGGEAPQRASFGPGEWPRFHRVPSTHVVTANGRLVLIAEDGGGRMT
jgi:hypothetical protein